MQRFLGSLLFFVLLVGCKSDRPDNVIREKEMTSLLRDLHLIDGYLNTLPSDSVTRISANLIEGVYRHYDVDSVTVRMSIEYYAEQPQVLNRIYVNVDNELKDMGAKAQELNRKVQRELFVKDSTRNAYVADSISRLKNDSMRSEMLKYLLYWKNPDSTDLKPKPWSWEERNRLLEKLKLNN
jgi:uncharacterized protein YcfL